MTAYSSRHPLSSPSPPRAAGTMNPARALNVLWQTVLVWQRRTHERAHLAQLDPHLRRDMGLSEADVADEVRKPFWVA